MRDVVVQVRHNTCRALQSSTPGPLCPCASQHPFSWRQRTAKCAQGLSPSSSCSGIWHCGRRIEHDPGVSDCLPNQSDPDQNTAEICQMLSSSYCLFKKGITEYVTELLLFPGRVKTQGVDGQLLFGLPRCFEDG